MNGYREAHTSKRLTIPGTRSFPKRKDVIVGNSSIFDASFLSGVQKAIFGIGRGFCTSAIMAAGLTACASSGALSQKNLDEIALNSSCEQPYILKYNSETIVAMPSETEDGKAILHENKLILHQAARLRLMGYEHALPVPKSGCADESITAFTLSEREENAVDTPLELYTKAMTAGQIKSDPTITCKPVYKQVYQPPLKLGGSGHVLQMSNGEKCELTLTNADTHDFAATDNQVLAKLKLFECSNEKPFMTWLPLPQLNQIRLRCNDLPSVFGITDTSTIEFLKQQSDFGSIFAQYNLAHFFLHDSSVAKREGLNILIGLAQNNHIPSHLDLSAIYSSGKLVSKDTERSEYHRDQAGLLTHMQWADMEQRESKFGK